MSDDPRWQEMLSLKGRVRMTHGDLSGQEGDTSRLRHFVRPPWALLGICPTRTPFPSTCAPALDQALH